jgi:steroid 5-alpha reductase family enzyme
MIPLIACGVAWCGSQNGQTFNDIPIFALCVGWAFLINWLAFIPAYIFQTEKFFDLVGSLTYVSVTLIALYLSSNLDTRSLIVASLVLIWAVRLGTFLFIRISQDGKDDRFDKIIPVFLRFLNIWNIQALWVTFTALAAFICVTSNTRKEMDLFAYIGLAIWVIGFLMEVIADFQKRQFKKNAANKGRFIQTGLWSKSRHPNYFGEILIWIGVFIISIPVLQGFQWIAILSPIFVYQLLMKMTGVPLLEAKADKKWGGQADYEAYKARTPVLFPKF